MIVSARSHQPKLDHAGLGPFKAAIIDLDGTLVDTLGDFAAALNAAFARHGLPAVAAADVERFVGKGSEHLVRSALVHVGAGVSRLPAMLDAYQESYAHVNGQHARVYDGVCEGLLALRARAWTLACVTNKPLLFAQELLRQLSLLPSFAHVYGGDSFARRKPDPMPLLETCRVMGLPPAQVLMVGDSINDALAARAAGLPVVLVSHGYNHGQDVRELLASGEIDAVVDRLDALPALLH